MSASIKYSIVIPVFNEEKSIELLYNRLKPVLKKLNGIYEIIFVDDGSKDETFDIIGKNANGKEVVKLTVNPAETDLNDFVVIDIMASEPKPPKTSGRPSLDDFSFDEEQFDPRLGKGKRGAMEIDHDDEHVR